MVVLLLIWTYVFFVIYINGISADKAIKKIVGQKSFSEQLAVDEVFILGLLCLSSLASISSLLFPIGFNALSFVTIITLFQLYFNYSRIKYDLRRSVDIIRSTDKFAVIVGVFILILVIASSASKIMPGDTNLYYVQCIRWIRKFSVVPGLGNLHGRFAFNSHFFIISSLFTFSFNNALIFPLNSVCFLVIGFTLYRNFLIGLMNKNNVCIINGLCFILIVRLLPALLNTPAPDLICALLVVYLFVLLVNGKNHLTSPSVMVMLILLVFTCITYKLSSILLLLVIPLIVRKFTVKIFLKIAVIGVVVFMPFFIRNYYLSGYLVYPFPALDIFSVVWKIPSEKAELERQLVKTWARIPKASHGAVVNMGATEWFPIWFKALGTIYKVLVMLIPIGLLTAIYLGFKRWSMLLGIQVVVTVNLIFWFIMAPDPRFAMGFIIINTALITSLLLLKIKVLDAKKIRFAMLVSLIIVCLQHRGIVLSFFNDKLWVIPSDYIANSSVKVRRYHTNFFYQVPVTDEQCFDLNLPCTPYRNDKLLLRGNKLEDGFYISK